MLFNSVQSDMNQGIVALSAVMSAFVELLVEHKFLSFAASSGVIIALNSVRHGQRRDGFVTAPRKEAPAWN